MNVNVLDINIIRDIQKSDSLTGKAKQLEFSTVFLFAL